MANSDTNVLTINGPIVGADRLGSSGIIYSISLANGMVVTSPEGFDFLNRVLPEQPESDDQAQRPVTQAA